MALICAADEGIADLEATRASHLALERRETRSSPSANCSDSAVQG